MKRIGSAFLEFSPELNNLSKDKALRGLSVIVQIGATLWIANDEMIRLERLYPERRSGEESHTYGEHTSFGLNDFLQLPLPPPSDPQDSNQIEEVNVEALDYRDGYLWLVGF
jgi:Protein of unknown function (DUF3616)